MTRFLDGPAEGQTLGLARAPKLLRVVQDGRKKWDALDRIEDVPRPEETVTVYVRVTEPFMVHVDMRDRKKSGWYQGADYRVAKAQPSVEIARDTKKWQAWCLEFMF